MPKTYIELFRDAPLSGMTNLVQTRQRALELQRLRVSWRDMDIRRVATPTPFNKNASFEQLFIIRVSYVCFSGLEPIRVTPWEEMFKVRPLKLGQTCKILHVKFKMADFLLGFGHGHKTVFCQAGHDTCALQIS